MKSWWLQNNSSFFLCMLCWGFWQRSRFFTCWRISFFHCCDRVMQLKLNERGKCCGFHWGKRWMNLLPFMAVHSGRFIRWTSMISTDSASNELYVVMCPITSPKSGSNQTSPAHFYRAANQSSLGPLSSAVSVLQKFRAPTLNVSMYNSNSIVENPENTNISHALRANKNKLRKEILQRDKLYLSLYILRILNYIWRKKVVHLIRTSNTYV